MKVNVKVKAVTVIDFNEDGEKVLRLTTEEFFKGIKRLDDGSYQVVDDCNVININLRAATAMLCNINDDISIYRCCQPTSFTQRQLALILMDARLELEREFIQAGDVIPTSIEGAERTADYDMFSTVIIKVTLSTKAQRRLDDALAL